MIFFLVHKVTMGFAVIGVINGSLKALGRAWFDTKMGKNHLKSLNFPKPNTIVSILLDSHGSPCCRTQVVTTDSGRNPSVVGISVEKQLTSKLNPKPQTPLAMRAHPCQ